MTSSLALHAMFWGMKLYVHFIAFLWDMQEAGATLIKSATAGDNLSQLYRKEKCCRMKNKIYKRKLNLVLNQEGEMLKYVGLKTSS